MQAFVFNQPNPLLIKVHISYCPLSNSKIGSNHGDYDIAQEVCNYVGWW
jgi:hypothetical protein